MVFIPQLGIGFQSLHDCMQWHATVSQCCWQTVPNCSYTVCEIPQCNRCLYSWYLNASSWRRPQSGTTTDAVHLSAKLLQVNWSDAMDTLSNKDSGFEFAVLLATNEGCAEVAWHDLGVQPPNTRRAVAFWTACSRFICTLAIRVSRTL